MATMSATSCDELISADEVSYNYDDIGIYAPTSVSEVGNRTTAEGKTYTANNLNQYTAIDDFTPQYDADGNQTLIKTETGVWSVVYNAENRPVRWTQGDTVISMDFDRMGRRVDYQETQDDQVATHFRFVYDNFLCVQRLDADNGNAVRTEFVWDPTEPIATRPLVMHAKNWDLNLFYTHDGNKNVSEVFYHALQNGIAAHYDYAPFGAVSRTSRATRVTNRDLISENPFRFSSEYHDDSLALVYYNYRYYASNIGRWNRRDPLVSRKVKNRYSFLNNFVIGNVDLIGLWMRGGHTDLTEKTATEILERLAMCFEESPQYKDAIEEIVGQLKNANIKTDKGALFDDNSYHFNRAPDASAMRGRMDYLFTQYRELINLIEQLQLAEGDSEKRNDACSSAMDSIGRLTHMWQDYYAHGINPTADDSVGRITGAPYWPTATPSSWGGDIIQSGEHGGALYLLWSLITLNGFDLMEPGHRAPDRETRLENAQRDTSALLNMLLPSWFSICGCHYFQDREEP